MNKAETDEEDEGEDAMVLKRRKRTNDLSADELEMCVKAANAINGIDRVAEAVGGKVRAGC